MVITLALIAVAVSLIMSGVNKITSPVIAQNQELALQESLKTVIDGEEFELLDEGEGYSVYKAIKGGEEKGLCVVTLGSGYGGEIKILTGIDKDRKVTGVELLNHSETAGLGANAQKPEFKNQYAGKSFGIGVNKKAASDTEIKALSGATVTSKAVTDCVNKALEIAGKY